MNIGKKYFSCNNLENAFCFFTDGLKLCCYDKEPITVEKSNLNGAIDKYFSRRNELIIKNQSENPPCKMCPLFQETNEGDELIHYLNMSVYTYCNYLCMNCSRTAGKAVNPEKYKHESYDCIEICDELKHRGLLADDLHIGCAMGEVTVHPRHNEIYDFIEGNARTVDFFINGSKYDQRLADILASSKNNKAIISIDAGTEQTYSRIKGVNPAVFSKVVDNLKKYRSHSSNIILKYILFKDVNCNQEDYSGFVQLCKEIQVSSMDISADETRKRGNEAEEYIVKALEFFISAAIKNNIKLSFVHKRMIGKKNFEAASKILLSLQELEPIEKHFDNIYSAERLICYGAGSNANVFLKKIESLDSRKPDVIWDMKATGTKEPMDYLGYPLEAPDFDSLDPKRDAVFISIMNKGINQQLIKVMKDRGFERVMSQHDAALAITLKRVKKFGADDLAAL